MKKKVGLFGLAMHVAIVVVFVFSRRLRGEQFGPEMLFVMVPLLLLSSFLVYFFAASRYVERREGMQKAVVIDSLIGILLEYVIFTLTAVLFSIYEGLRIGAGEGAGMVSSLLSSLFRNILWVYGVVPGMLQILVLGNLCGLVGWYVLKRTKP